VRGLNFLVSGELYAVDVTLVESVARKLTVTPVPSAPNEVVGIANLKGRVITILSLDELLGVKETSYIRDTVNVIIFKSGSGSEDQMGLLIDRPGNLIDIDEKSTRPPPLTAGKEEGFCISGIAEVDDKIYRIINLDSIKKKYMTNTENITANTSFGGNNND